jgi:hypothetical protein
VDNPEPLPGIGALGAWQANLSDDERALRYLKGERGLTIQTIRRYEIGITRDTPGAFVFPIRDENGALVNLKRRFWPDPWVSRDGEPRKSRALAGRASCLYPIGALRNSPRAFVVCEGEFDALLLNQHRIPAVTSTAGSSWRPEWDACAAGRFVAVLYDAGANSYELAEDRASQFRAAGARDAWPVDLTLAGFSKGRDVTDWFITCGWTSDDLWAFIRERRRWFREARGCVRRRRQGGDHG